MIGQNSQRNYDAIIIGSGMGGLTVASLLAQIGKKRVLVLEQHFKLGGYTHSFRRGKFEWDVGVHYIGEMHPQNLSRRVMDLVTDRQVQWHRCGPVVERIFFPNGMFEYPDDPKLLEQRLQQMFPDERRAIRRYFRDVKKCQGWIARFFFSKMLTRPLAELLTLPGRKLALKTTEEYLQSIQSSYLKAILTAQWPDYGTVPADSAFGVHAAVTGDFFRGSFYPVGGAQEISRAVEKVVIAGGGDCLVNHSVQEVLVENGRAVGVRAVHKGREIEFYAPVVVSNTNSITTYNRLIPSGFCQSERQQAQRIRLGTSAMALFIGLNDDPRRHGLDDANYWFFDSLAHEPPTSKRDIREISGGYLSFGSLRNPTQTHHTAQIVTFSPYGGWKQFAGQPWLRRGAEYDQLKSEVTEQLLRLADQHVPQLRPLIQYTELSTPVTFEKFSGHPGGMVYGQQCDPDRLSRYQWRVSTSLPNFYQAGCDVGIPGVNGSMMASIFTAAKILGMRSLLKILA